MLDIIHITSDLLGQVAHAATYQWEVPFPPAPGGGAPDTTIESVVNYVYTWGLALGGAFAFVRLVIAGIQWGTSGTVFAAGNAKQTMQEVGFGLVILLGSWLLLNTINPQIVNPSFNPPQLPAGNGDKGGMNNDSRTGGTQTTGGATGAVGNFTTNTAASLGFGSNSVGTSFIKMLESLPLGDVQDNTWTQAQAPSYGAQGSSREEQEKIANASFQQFCQAVSAAYPTPPKPLRIKAKTWKSIIGYGALNTSCSDKPNHYICTPKKYTYVMPVEDDGTECRHWGSTPVANDIFTVSQDYRGNGTIPPGLTAPVLAFVKGTIISSYTDPVGGNAILLAGADKKIYYYAHMCNRYVHIGQSVKAGDVLGMMGNTGLGGGQQFSPELSHLHFAECYGDCPTGANQLTFPDGQGNVCPSADFGYIFDSDYQAQCSKDIFRDVESKWCCNKACPWDKEASAK